MPKDKKKQTDPTALVEKQESKDLKENTIVIINGQKLDPKELQSLTIQYLDGTLVVELTTITEMQKTFTSAPDSHTQSVDSHTLLKSLVPLNLKVEKAPSTKGISITKTKGPEVYPLDEDGLLKLSAMSTLRTNKKDDSNNPVSKLKLVLTKKALQNYDIVENLQLTTDDFNITDVTSISSALNDLAVLEQKVQRDPMVVKVVEVSSPKIVITENIFHLTEKFKLYKVKE